MGNNAIWMKLYMGDYLADTRSLTTEEHGAYLLLLMTYYRTGPLPNDSEKLARIAGLTRRRWDGLAQTIKAFFTVAEDGLLHNKRADAEIEKNRVSAESNKGKAKKAAEARWNADAPSMDAAMLQAYDNPAKPDAPSMVSQMSEVRSHKEPVQELVLSSDEKRTKHCAKKAPDPRRTAFLEIFAAYYRRKNPGMAVPTPGAADNAELSRFLQQQPDFTLEQWQQVIANRERSPVTHSQSLNRWLKDALAFYQGPADKYGNTIQTKGAPNNGSITRNGSPAEQQVIDAGRALLNARERARCAPLEHDFRGSTLEAGHADTQSAGSQHHLGTAY